MTDTEKLKLIDKMIADSCDFNYNEDAYTALCNAIVNVIDFKEDTDAE